MRSRGKWAEDDGVRGESGPLLNWGGCAEEGMGGGVKESVTGGLVMTGGLLSVGVLEVWAGFEVKRPDEYSTPRRVPTAVRTAAMPVSMPGRVVQNPAGLSSS